MQDSLTDKRVSLTERRPAARHSLMVSQTEAELIQWFEQAHTQLQAQVEQMPVQEVAQLLGRVHSLIRHQQDRFAGMLEIGQALGKTFHIDDLLKVIVERTTELMNAERSTLFLVDEENQELWSKIIQGQLNIEIRLPVGEGIAGWVAKMGEGVRIDEPYEDTRFNPKFDEATGYHTRNILCLPICNIQGQIIGVLQVLNRLSGDFSLEDEHLLGAIAAQAAVVLENSKLYLAAIERNLELIDIKDKLERKVSELDMLYELERQLGRAEGLIPMVEGVLQRTLRLVHASAAIMTLYEETANKTFCLVDRGEWEHAWNFEEEVSLRQTAAVEIHPAHHKTQFYRRSAHATHSPLLCATVERAAARLRLPIDSAVMIPLREEDSLIGTLELYNAGDESGEGGELGFQPDDGKLLSLIMSQLVSSIQARRHREEEEKNERLASIGQMLSGVLHDFKNPMAIISGYVQLMSRAKDTQMRQTYADNILKQLDQVNQMTRELLMFARGDRRILLRKVFVHKFMDEVAELLAPELESHHVHFAMELGYRHEAKLDQVKLKRALLNLGRNAAEAMHGRGGHFLIKVDQVPTTLGVKEVTHDLRFALQDDGPGIPVSIRDRLFESFVTQGKEHGTGLGLAIVKQIVNDHLGTIEFETSELGTTFLIHLPLYAKGQT